MSSAAYHNGQRAECARLRAWAFGDGVKVHKWEFDRRYWLTIVAGRGPNLAVVDDFGDLIRVQHCFA